MRLAQGLAFAVPLALFVALGSPSPYWLDSGEFIAAANALAVSHPPGHPLFALAGKTLTLLPLGPIAFRVGLASALCAALAALVVFWAARALALRSRLGAGAAGALALASALVVGTSGSLGLQAVRAEVYALQALLTLGAMALGARALEEGVRDSRHMIAAGLCAGLSLANHHFLGLLALPGLAAALAASLGGPARRPARSVGTAVAVAFALGLVPYLFLPLRAGAFESLGAPDNLRDFFWVVSAEVYQKSAYAAPGPWADRIADVVLLLARDLAGVGLIAALGGAYVVFRVRGLRPLAWIWVPLAILYPLARAWLGFIRDNPDAAGYVVPGLAAQTLLAVAFFGVITTTLPAGKQHLIRLALVLTVAMAVIIGPGRADRYSLRGFWAAEDFVGAATSDIGPRGVIVASSPGTAFVLAAERATSNERPDVTVVALPFLGYPGYAGALARRDRGVAALVRATILDGNLSEIELAALAAARPTLLELDAALPRDIDVYLEPRGPLAFARGEPVSLADLDAGAAVHRARWQRAVARLGSWATSDRETRSVLLWHRYLEALLYASRGQRDLAYESAEAAEAAIPGTPELRDLRLALREGRGPLDVAPFLPRESGQH